MTDGGYRDPNSPGKRSWFDKLLDIIEGRQDSRAFDWIMLILVCGTLLYVLLHVLAWIGRAISG